MAVLRAKPPRYFRDSPARCNGMTPHISRASVMTATAVYPATNGFPGVAWATRGPPFPAPIKTGASSAEGEILPSSDRRARPDFRRELVFLETKVWVLRPA